MKVSILLITHQGIGRELLSTAHRTFGELPLKIAQLSVSHRAELEDLSVRANKLIQVLDCGAGVLILTDMFGATPSNIAQRICKTLKHKVKIISGLNLPMLIRVLNYSHLDLLQLSKKAVSGGRDGVIESTEHEDLYPQTILNINAILSQDLYV